MVYTSTAQCPRDGFRSPDPTPRCPADSYALRLQEICSDPFASSEYLQQAFGGHNFFKDLNLVRSIEIQHVVFFGGFQSIEIQHVFLL